MSGLENYGNTCYMNSSQVLRYTKPVVEPLLDAKPNDEHAVRFSTCSTRG